MSEEELKPCPQCGDLPRIWNYERDGYWSVRCIGFKRRHKYVDHCFEAVGDTKSDAISAWNKRIESDDIPEWLKEKIIDLKDTYCSNTDISKNCIFALDCVLSLKKDD